MCRSCLVDCDFLPLILEHARKILFPIIQIYTVRAFLHRHSHVARQKAVVNFAPKRLKVLSSWILRASAELSVDTPRLTGLKQPGFHGKWCARTWLLCSNRFLGCGLQIKANEASWTRCKPVVSLTATRFRVIFNYTLFSDLPFCWRGRWSETLSYSTKPLLHSIWNHHKISVKLGIISV